MDEIETQGATQRGTAARLGCLALCLIQPGLGLLRVGAGRTGTLVMLAPSIWLLGSVGLFALAPRPTFAAIIVYAATSVFLAVTVEILAVVMTWRRSAVRAAKPPSWTRWYALLALAIGSALASNALVAVAYRFYKPFYLPNESMAPTFGKLDKIVADMRAVRNPEVGDIVLIKVGASIFIRRVVGLPGDRIALKADMPIINGVTTRTRSDGETRFLGADGWKRARRMQEQFPREAEPHEIALTTPTGYGEMAERTVPPGHVFVLGDNREFSADSRISQVAGGVGMIPLTDLIGRPLYVTWAHDRGVIGRPAGH